MQSKIYKEDAGTKFGKWDDEISRFLYFDSIKEILDKISIPAKVADYGGANGLLREQIQNVITIDIDPEKKPDIVDNIIEHNEKYDLVIIRYVLHYLTDEEIIKLFKNIKAKNILVIQFVNENLEVKYQNSKNEGFKFFRNEKQLMYLLPNSGMKIYEKYYQVTKEFYHNRLGVGNYSSHNEKLIAIYYENYSK